MQIKLMPEEGQNGQMDICACLMDKIRDESGLDIQEQMVCNLGSIGNGGLEKLIKLSNSVNYILLESALENARDSIVCSRSYGVIYLIKQILDKWYNYSDLALKSEDEKMQTLYNLLPSLLAALLDKSISADSSLSDLKRRIYFPNDINLDAAAIRSLINSADFFPNDQLNEILNCGKDQDNGQRFKKALSGKLLAWATSDCGPWHNFDEAEGLMQIVNLAVHLHESIELETGLSWQVINSSLSDLQAIRVERGARTLLLMTRPTSMQLNIFYRLDIKPPPLVIVEQYEQPIITSEESESDLCETMDSINDPFHETCAVDMSVCI